MPASSGRKFIPEGKIEKNGNVLPDKTCSASAQDVMISNNPPAEVLENRVLVLMAPESGASSLPDSYVDAPGVKVCTNIQELCHEVARGTGALLISGEALERAGLECLSLSLREQPEWSDIPVIVLLGRGQTTEAGWRILQELTPLGNVTLIEHPARPVCVLSAVQAGLKARQKQYELRNHLASEERKDNALRETEQALRDADVRRDSFLAMLAHELRNPLGPIRNAVHVLEIIGSRETETARVRRMIDRQVGHLSHLLDDLLDVSRLTSGRIKLRLERLDLVPLIRAVSEDHRSNCEKAGVTLMVSTPLKPLWVFGDSTRLSQVMANLIDNACKFTESGGRISVGAWQDGADHIHLTVRDTGIGMEPGTLVNIFDSFTQADGGLDRSAGGLGLGLALVRGLIELHKGTVEASSQGLGHGSQFTLRLPAASAPELEARSENSPEEANVFRILIIEDNIDAAESMGLLLRLSGHTVGLSHTGAEGVEKARDFKPEIVICDIGLPGGMDGYEVARALRADPQVDSSYLIALTGYGQEEDQMKARLSGFDLHLTKPVDPSALKRLLSGPMAEGSRQRVQQ